MSMAKPKVYGSPSKDPKMSSHLDRCWQRKLKRQRQRENATRSPVAGQITKEKEGRA